MSREDFLSNFLDIVSLSKQINSLYNKYLANKTFDTVDRFADIISSGYRGSPEEKARLKRWVINHTKGVRSRYGSLAKPNEKKQFVDEMYLSFGESKLKYETTAGTPIPEGEPDFPVNTFGATGNKVDRDAIGSKYFEPDYRRTRPNQLVINTKAKRQLVELVFGILPKDLNNRYYEELRNAGIGSDIINSIRKSLSAGNMTDEERNDLIGDLNDYIGGFQNQKFTSRDERGKAITLTAGERRLIRINHYIAQGMATLINLGSIKVLSAVLDRLTDKLLPREYRTRYGKDRGYGKYLLSSMTGTSYLEDIKMVSDKGLRLAMEKLTPKDMADNRMTTDSFKNMAASMENLGTKSRSLQQWYHNSDSDILLFRYDMSYSAHFDWLQDMDRPFDICDVYSGQFFQSEDTHPYLDYKNEEPTKAMYDFNGGLITGVYNREADIYNAKDPGRRDRTINSFNFPRTGEVSYPVFLTMGELITQLVATGLPMGFFKNLYLPWDCPHDHPGGWCIIIPVSLRMLITKQNLKIPEPKEIRVSLAPTVIEERVKLKHKLVEATALLIGDYIWNKRDKKGSIIESKSFSDKLELEIEKALPNIEKLIGIKEAWTLDYKRRIVSTHYKLKRAVTGQYIDEYGLAGRIMVRDFSSVLSKKPPIRSFYTPQGDSIDGWMSPVLRREGPKAKRVVSKRMVALRKHTYKHRVFVKGKPKDIISGIGDIIIYPKNIEYWRKKGLPKGVVADLVSEQVADAVGQNIIKTAKIGNHLKRPGKEKLTKMFYKRLREIREVGGTKVKRLADRYHRAKKLDKQVRIIFEYMVKEPELFKDEFSEIFKFLVQKTRYKLKEEIRSRLLDSLSEGIGSFYMK